MTRYSVLLDTSLGSTNLGDAVIVDRFIRAVPEVARATRLPTHAWWRASDIRAASHASVAILAGTNILAPTMWRRRQWKLTPLDMVALRGKTVLAGVGWGGFTGPPLDRLSRAQLRPILRPDFPIGVRDRYTEKQVEKSGLAAEYIACPTLWDLPPLLPRLTVESEVVTTLTDYRRVPGRDTALLRGLLDRFDRVFLWPQGASDATYMSTLGVAGVELLPRTMAAFESALDGRAYVGTRLHGGIGALHAGSPSLIIAVDNRALHMATDTNLPVLDGNLIPGGLSAAIDTLAERRELVLPVAEIRRWRAALTALVSAA